MSSNSFKSLAPGKRRVYLAEAKERALLTREVMVSTRFAETWSEVQFV